HADVEQCRAAGEPAAQGIRASSGAARAAPGGRRGPRRTHVAPIRAGARIGAPIAGAATTPVLGHGAISSGAWPGAGPSWCSASTGSPAGSGSPGGGAGSSAGRSSGGGAGRSASGSTRSSAGAGAGSSAGGGGGGG